MKSKQIFIVRLAITLSTIFVITNSYANKMDIYEDIIDRYNQPDNSLLDPDQIESLTDKIDYALYLHAFKDGSSQRNLIIKSIIKEINNRSSELLAESENSYIQSVLDNSLREYDGTDNSLIPTLRMASLHGVIRTHSAFYAIPCDVLVSKPNLLEATSVYWGGNLDNFMPRSGCAWGRGNVKAFPNEQVSAFIYKSTCCDGDFLYNFEGTARFGHAKRQSQQVERLKLMPEQSFKDRVISQWDNAVSSLFKDDGNVSNPYETWSYLSLDNRSEYLKLLPYYKDAVNALSLFYQQEKKFKELASIIEAKRGLSLAVFGADCGDTAPPISLRRLIIDDSSVVEIENYLKTNELTTASVQPFFNCSYFAGIDPLIHIAVKDPNILKLLWEYAHTSQLTNEEAVNIDFDVGVNTPNHFNKTPLMTSAQYDFVDSAVLLLDKGANINAKTNREWINLEHDNRTALMYAAANASLGMISLLINYGADIDAEDTKGLRALDYLLGRGPVPKNPNIHGDDLELAMQLLM